MNPLYRLFDKIFDKPPQGTDDAGKVLYYEAEDESYRRYKNLCYRNLILETLLAFACGAVFHFLLQCC